MKPELRYSRSCSFNLMAKLSAAARFTEADIIAAQNTAATQYRISSPDLDWLSRQLGCSDHNQASESAIPLRITTFKKLVCSIQHNSWVSRFCPEAYLYRNMPAPRPSRRMRDCASN